MILIDFQGGSHGNFLEMVLNSIYFGKRLDAFSQNGTSHSKPYKESDVKFLADHHSFIIDSYYYDSISNYEAIILIHISPDDLPILQMICNLRAGNAGIDLRSVDLIKKMISDYNQKDKTEITHPVHKDFFNQLENWSEIQNGQININPVREMIKFGFRKDGNGFLEKQEQAIINYPKDKPLIKFPFAAFYDYESFNHELTKLFTALNIDMEIPSFVWDQHQKFIQTNKAADLLDKPRQYFDLLIQEKDVDISDMDLYQQAYFDHLYENHYAVRAMYNHPDGNYFQTTSQVLNYVRSANGH